MPPFALIEHSLVHIFDFKGRAGRAEYWYWFLFTIGFGIGLHFIGMQVSMLSWLSKVWVGLAFLVGISLTVRRLHDIDLSGKWFLMVPGAVLLTIAVASVAPEFAAHLLFVPVVLVIIFYFFVGFGPGEPDRNRFGEPFPARHNNQS